MDFGQTELEACCSSSGPLLLAIVLGWAVLAQPQGEDARAGDRGGRPGASMPKRSEGAAKGRTTRKR